MVFTKERKFLFISSFSNTAIMKGVGFYQMLFWDDFYWDNHVVSVFYSINVVYYIYAFIKLFSNVKPYIS